MEPREALLEAGRIASRVRGNAASLVDVGVPVIDICDGVEKAIEEMGGRPAFPCNVDMDEVAAHYTSPRGDRTLVPEGALVKVDIGVHVEGYIADTATTICLDPGLRSMVEAAEEGLEAAIRTVRAGVRSSEIGSVIERAIRAKGYSPIRNLTGHKLARYVVHAGKSIPNVSTTESHVLQEGDVYAIEPFTTPMSADGSVRDGPVGHIYVYRKKARVGEAAKSMLKYIQSEYRSLPFASRWVVRRFPGQEGAEAFQELVRARCLYSYPQLVERKKGPVAQAEHTVIVTSDGCVVTTA